MKKAILLTLFTILMATSVAAGMNTYYNTHSYTNPIYDNWCQGTDFDKSGHVEMHDYNYFKDWYGSKCNRENNFCEGADLIKNDRVDLSDFVFFANHYGLTGCHR